MLAHLRSRVRLWLAKSNPRFIGLYRSAELRDLWPPAGRFPSGQIKVSSLYGSREDMLQALEEGGVGGEVGIFRCAFTPKLLLHAKPTKLHLFDIDSEAIAIATQTFRSDISSGVVHVHLGDSATSLESMPESYFDWLYVDGDHSYGGVVRDIRALLPKVKPGGRIVFNDFTFFDPLSMTKFGVMEAVIELCQEGGCYVVGFAFHPRGFHDIMIEKPIEV